MEEIKELAKCVKCNEFSEVDTDVALMSNPPQYQFTCSSCSNKQFIWGSFIYRIPRSILAKADEYEAKAKAFDRIINQRNQAGTDMYGKEDDVVESVIESAFWNIDGIIVEYESGEYDVKK